MLVEFKKNGKQKRMNPKVAAHLIKKGYVKAVVDEKPYKKEAPLPEKAPEPPKPVPPPAPTPAPARQEAPQPIRRTTTTPVRTAQAPKETQAPTE